MKKMAVSGWALMASATLLAGLYGDTPDAKHAWAVHDWNRPKPAKVEVDARGVPSDAIVLFDGSRESLEKNWCDGKGGPTGWAWREGDFFSVPEWKNGGSIRTRREFGDCQLHLEYMHEPDRIYSDKGAQMRGNSGVFLMNNYEVQILESYYTSSDLQGKPGFVDNYADGQAGAVYAENPPAVNPARKPGEWQVYDIVFHQPIWKDGRLVHPGSITVFFNGVLVQDHWEMEGLTTHCRRRPLAPHAPKGPLLLQDHGCVVHFRNIWIREIPSRWDNKTHSAMSADEAEVMKLRNETAARLFAGVDVSRAGDAGELRKMLEVLAYSKDAKYTEACRKMCGAYAEKLAGAKGDAAKSLKGEVDGVWNDLMVLRRNDVIPADCPLSAAIGKFRRDNGL